MTPGVKQAQREPRSRQAARAAAELIVFADGLEQGGWAAYAQRARNVAREAIWLACELEHEQHARQAVQQARDRLLEMVTDVSSRSAGGQGAIRGRTASPAPLAVSGLNGKIVDATNCRGGQQ